jgi:hypothetical protein
VILITECNAKNITDGKYFRISMDVVATYFNKSFKNLRVYDKMANIYELHSIWGVLQLIICISGEMIKKRFS